MHILYIAGNQLPLRVRQGADARVQMHRFRRRRLYQVEHETISIHNCIEAGLIPFFTVHRFPEMLSYLTARPENSMEALPARRLLDTIARKFDANFDGRFNYTGE